MEMIFIFTDNECGGIIDLNLFNSTEEKDKFIETVLNKFTELNKVVKIKIKEMGDVRSNGDILKAIPQKFPDVESAMILALMMEDMPFYRSSRIVRDCVRHDLINHYQIKKEVVLAAEQLVIQA